MEIIHSMCATDSSEGTRKIIYSCNFANVPNFCDVVDIIVITDEVQLIDCVIIPNIPNIWREGWVYDNHEHITTTFDRKYVFRFTFNRVLHDNEFIS